MYNVHIESYISEGFFYKYDNCSVYDDRVECTPLSSIVIDYTTLVFEYNTWNMLPTVVNK